MIAVLQRVSRARVTVDEEVTGEIALGLLVLLGVERGDRAEDAAYLAGRVTGLRVFPDAAGRMNCSVLEVGGSVLAISNFTVAGDTTRGRRPSFDRAASAEVAQPLYEHFVKCVRDIGVTVATGVFQAVMKVELANEGPVTVICRSKSKEN